MGQVQQSPHCAPTCLPPVHHRVGAQVILQMATAFKPHGLLSADRKIHYAGQTPAQGQAGGNGRTTDATRRDSSARLPTVKGIHASLLCHLSSHV
jgi:hypothetical protein